VPNHNGLLNSVKYEFKILNMWGLVGISAGKACATTLLLAILLAGHADARLNLSQHRESFVLSRSAAGAFGDYLATEVRANQWVPSDAARALLLDLPSRLSDSCGDAVEAWRSGAGPTATLTLRMLNRDAGGVWLALRCNSSRRDLAQYYDERLLVIRPTTGEGELIPFDLDADKDPTLYHIEFQEELLTKSGPAVAIRVSSDNNNPCCDGPTRFKEERLLILTGTGTGTGTGSGVKQVFSTKLLQEQDNHDDIGGDTHTLYVAKVSLERDDRQQVETIVVKFSEEADGKVRRSGVDRYGWDAESGKYVEKD